MEKSSSELFKLNVRLYEPTRVAPAEETPKGLYYLSNLDQIFSGVLRLVFFYEKGNDSTAEVIKNALSKLLVYYYPLAGRLATTAHEKLIVDCTGEGAIFVEAEASCRMDELGDITQPNPPTLGKLVYFDLPEAKKILQTAPLVVQVTKFRCGGFVLGLCFNHCMLDGASTKDFLNSWGEIARGLPLKVVPFMDRSILKPRDPLKIEFCHDELNQIEDISNITELYNGETCCRSFTFDCEMLDQLKRKATEDGTLTRCTAFEALAGLVWRARTEALKMHPEQDAKLLLYVNGRSRFNPPIPKGYFGNAILLTNSTCKAGELLEKPFSYAVKLVQDAIDMASESYVRSTIDCFEKNRTKPAYAGTLPISNWSSIPLYDADFGWGKPIFLGPVAFNNKEMTAFLSDGKGRSSINLALHLPTSAMKAFEKLVAIYMVRHSRI